MFYFMMILIFSHIAKIVCKLWGLTFVRLRVNRFFDMADLKKEKQAKIDREDEISATVSENKKKEEHFIDGLKTGNQMKKRYFDKPFDEQMYDSLDEIRDQDKPQEE